MWVRTIVVQLKNFTLSADKRLIEGARDVARKRKSAVNGLFREWLAHLVQQRHREAKSRDLNWRLEHANAGGKFGSEEMRERGGISRHANY
jgi:hypothetical protein